MSYFDSQTITSQMNFNKNNCALKKLSMGCYGIADTVIFFFKKEFKVTNS